MIRRNFIKLVFAAGTPLFVPFKSFDYSKLEGFAPNKASDKVHRIIRECLLVDNLKDGDIASYTLDDSHIPCLYNYGYIVSEVPSSAAISPEITVPTQFKYESPEKQLIQFLNLLTLRTPLKIKNIKNIARRQPSAYFLDKLFVNLESQKLTPKKILLNEQTLKRFDEDQILYEREGERSIWDAKIIIVDNLEYGQVLVLPKPEETGVFVARKDEYGMFLYAQRHIGYGQLTL